MSLTDNLTYSCSVQPKDDLRVRNVMLIKVLFGVAANAGIVARAALHIEHQLEMKMRWPATVLVHMAKGGDLLASSNGLTYHQVGQTLSAQVAVQTVQDKSIQVMLEDDGGAVVAKVIIILKAVYAAIKRGVYRREGRPPYIGA